ncbi:MAG: NB-ARC domain-containing protein, partial [Ktedonobacterales bacterium]
VERLANPAPSVTALSGAGGIGKTTLAAAAARQLAKARFPDGIAVIVGGGVGGAELTDPPDVLNQVLARFEPGYRQPGETDMAKLANEANRLLNGKQVLIVIDDVHPELSVGSVIQPLLRAGAVILLTARRVFPGDVVPAEGYRLLDVLPLASARELFVQQMTSQAKKALDTRDLANIDRVVNALERHTLAIKLAGAYAAETSLNLDDLLRELMPQPLDVPVPKDTPPGVWLIFRGSLERLGIHARRLFAALAVFATEEFGERAAVEVATSLDIIDPRATLDLLCHRAFVSRQESHDMPEGSDSVRLHLHPLLQQFARIEFDSLSTTLQYQMHRAVTQFFARYVQETSARAFGADQRNIAGALDWASEHSDAELVAQLCTGMQYFWRDRWLTRYSLRYLPIGIDAAQEIWKKTQLDVDRLHIADLELTYAQVLRRSGQMQEAEGVLQTNLQ